jgi:hypothetical protein
MRARYFLHNIHNTHTTQYIYIRVGERERGFVPPMTINLCFLNKIFNTQRREHGAVLR